MSRGTHGNELGNTEKGVGGGLQVINIINNKNNRAMYENVSEQRKQELNILKVWAECAGDTYYYSMPQSRFDKNMEGCEEEEFFKAYSRQRKIGLEAHPTKPQIAKIKIMRIIFLSIMGCRIFSYFISLISC